jgi:hypothetical protein
MSPGLKLCACRDCYQATNSPLLPVANRELDEFLANAAQPLLPAP